MFVRQCTQKNFIFIEQDVLCVRFLYQPYFCYRTKYNILQTLFVVKSQNLKQNTFKNKMLFK